MSEQKRQKDLCPFKRIVEREYNGHKGVAALRERFDVCAGERCMAYQEPSCGIGKPTCKRLENGSK